MRISLASIHPRALSGQIEGLVGLAKELERAGHEVEVVSAFGEGLMGTDRLSPAEGDSGSLAGKLARIGSILARLAGKAAGFDLVHLNLPTPAFAILGDLLRGLVDVPVVVGFEAHLAETGRLVRSGSLWESPGFYFPRIMMNNGLVARCSWHRCEQYIVSSHYQAAELRRLGFPSARVGIAPNVIDATKLRRLDKKEARRQLGLPEGHLIAYVGHYHHVKGVEVLVEAFGHLIRDREDCHLALAWSGLGDDGPVRQAIVESGVVERVLHLNRVPIGAALSAVDVLVLPYRLTMGQSAYPELLLEAMAVGVPLVTSDLAMLRELGVHEQTALLVPPGDARATAIAVGRLLEDEMLARAIVAAQRRLLEGPLNPIEVTKRYLSLYQVACARKAGVKETLTTAEDGHVPIHRRLGPVSKGESKPAYRSFMAQPGSPLLVGETIRETDYAASQTQATRPMQ